MPFVVEHEVGHLVAVVHSDSEHGAALVVRANTHRDFDNALVGLHIVARSLQVAAVANFQHTAGLIHITSAPACEGGTQLVGQAA